MNFKTALLSLSLLLPSAIKADLYTAAVSKNAGSYVQTYSVNASSTTPTLLVDGSIGIRSANIDIFNNSAYILYIGTNTSTLASTGIPILSSKTYTLDGTFTGDLYGLGDPAGSATTNARTIYYLKNDAIR